jgi:apolipoprotein D and lipocalin family protein
MKAKILTTFLISGLSNIALAVDLDGVQNFDPQSYLGTWYQIQSTNPFFQRGCKCAKADYETIDDRTIQVLNTCVKENGQVSSITGKAYIPNQEEPSRLSVRFSPISFGNVNYVVTEVGDNYEYAVVVSPGNAPVWILAREKQLSPSIIAGIKLRLIAAGVRIADLKDTDPRSCPELQ